MALRDPLTEAERRIVELRIEQIGNAWEREGEHVRADWEERNIETIGRSIWQQRVAGQREQLEPRIRQMADASANHFGPPGPARPTAEQ